MDGLVLTHGAGSLGRFDPSRLAAGRGPLTAGLVNLRIGGAGQQGLLQRRQIRVAPHADILHVEEHHAHLFEHGDQRGEGCLRGVGFGVEHALAGEESSDADPVDATDEIAVSVPQSDIVGP